MIFFFLFPCMKLVVCIHLPLNFCIHVCAAGRGRGRGRGPARGRGRGGNTNGMVYAAASTA
jgi:hypothetical protein